MTIPSFDEMKDAVGAVEIGHSSSLSALEERGHIRRLANRARRLRLLMRRLSKAIPPSADSNVVHANFGRLKPVLPLLGQIAAGTPIEAISDLQFLDVPASMIAVVSISR